MNTHQVRTQKILQTSLYFAVTILIGLFLSARGAMLPNLAAQANVGLSEIGIIITASSIGFLLSNLYVGRLYDRFPGHRVMGTAFIVTAMILTLLPMAKSLFWLFVIFLLSGLTRGAIILGTNTLPLWIYGEKSAGVMNALAGFFGAGSILGPLAVSQVLQRTGITNWVYWVTALGFLLLVPAAFLIPSPVIRKEPVSNPASIAPHTINENKQIIFLMALFLVFYVGAEVGLGSWITTFGKTQLPADQVHKAFELASTFWIAVMSGRFLSALLSKKVNTEILLGIDLLGMIGSLVVIIASNGHWVTLFVSTITLGLSMASIFPLVFSLAEEVMDVTGRISSLLFVGASTGSVIFPLLMGRLIDLVSPVSFMVALLAMTLVDCAIFFFLYLSIRRNKTKHQG